MEFNMERAARMCPKCGGWCGVYKSWERNTDGAYIRRRYCTVCDTEFETMEVATGYIKKRKIIKKVRYDGQGRKSVVELP